MLYIGVECFSLSSSPISSEEGHIIACPHTTVTLTCTATQVGSMTWRYQDLVHTFLSHHIENEQTRVVHQYSIINTVKTQSTFSTDALSFECHYLPLSCSTKYKLSSSIACKT